MKFQAAIFCVLILSVVGMSLNGCEDEEDHQIYRVLKNANCKLSPQIEKFKSEMGRFWSKIEGVKGLFSKKKTTEEFDFDEIDVSEEIITMRGKREETEEENGEVQGKSLNLQKSVENWFLKILKENGEVENKNEAGNNENQIAEETITTEVSPDYLIIKPFNLFRAPVKCADGKQNAGGRCRTIFS